jgi:hypothetical protein
VKRILTSLAAASALVCFAQERGSDTSQFADYMSPGMEVSGIRAPFHDDQGRLQAQLYGGYAKVRDGGVAEITNLRIDVYRDDRVAMTIFAPKCVSRQQESSENPGTKVLSVTSDSDVLIELQEMSVIGRGFRFSSEHNRFEILHDAKVLVKAPARNRKGAGL